MNVPEPSIILTDSSGRIVWFNEATTELCGYKLSEIVGEKPGAVLQGKETDSRTVKTISACIHNRVTFQGEILNYHKDGHSYCVQLSINPIYDRGQSSRLAGFLGVSILLESRSKSTTAQESDLITICSCCKDYKESEKQWRRIERLLLQLKSMSISHGLCPKCINKYFDLPK